MKKYRKLGVGKAGEFVFGAPERPPQKLCFDFEDEEKYHIHEDLLTCDTLPTQVEDQYDEED